MSQMNSFKDLAIAMSINDKLSNLQSVSKRYEENNADDESINDHDGKFSMST